MVQEAKDELDTFEEPGDLEDYMYDVDIARRVEQDKLNAIHAASIDLKGKVAR